MKGLSTRISGLVLALLSQGAWAESSLNLPRGVSPNSQSIYDLHMLIFWVCVVIGVLVFGVMLYALIKHRKSAGAVAAQFHGNTAVEIVWAVIPFLILVAMAIPATLVLVRMKDTSDADVTVKITGYQWKWKYEYLDEGISFVSNLSTPRKQIENKEAKGTNYLLEVDKPLVLPTDKKIRFIITANDVIHSWWVPALGVKQDAVPGFINESWTRIKKPGTYRGQCAELCGRDHGYMPVVVVAKPWKEYQQWLKTQRAHSAAAAAASTKTWTMQALMQRGEKVYNTACAACHKPDGTGMPPAFPALKDSPVIKGSVKKHIDVVLNGVPGTAMQAFGGQLNDADIAAIVTYERNAWGNDRGDVVQPSDVKALRSQGSQ